MSNPDSVGVWQTFTFRLPFTLGLTYTGNENHDVRAAPPAEWQG